MWKPLTLTLTGVAPLLMHNGQLADPLSPFSKAMKEVAGRRLKSDADHEELARLEFLGGLWVNDEKQPCIPSEAMEACLVGGARKSKEGKAAVAALLIEEHLALGFEGPETPEELWADEQFRLRVPARVGQARVMRTRPIFRHWSAIAVVQFNSDLINASQVQKWVRVSGDQVGLGDWRPKFGRFSVEVTQS
ncbi:hypothetical protein [Brevundimonas sp.]|uniref:hypothetical protein n=1 Tax=Brevundimonas sp. TaxID=1871086 RepID=UPI001A1BED37|nr:hypothetical protein [Brevundimonas sp.]MBJ7485966.1 hypothetical protein [Brevundimonas sp.]